MKINILYSCRKKWNYFWQVSWILSSVFWRLRQSLTDEDRGYFNVKESLKTTWNLTSIPLQSRSFSYSWSIRFHLQYNNCKISVTGKRKGQLIKYKLLALFLQWIGSDYFCLWRNWHKANQCISPYRAAQVVKEREAEDSLASWEVTKDTHFWPHDYSECYCITLARTGVSTHLPT